MSEEKVEIVRSMYEAFNDGDRERAITYLHPDAELHQPPELPDVESYVGLAEFERGIDLWLDEWESFRYEIEGLTDLGEKVLMEIRLWGIAKGSGVEIERSDVFHLSKPPGCRSSALDEKQHPSARYCVGDVAGESRRFHPPWIRQVQPS